MRNKLWMLICFIALPLMANSSWDSERIDLETRIQSRIDEALTKIISRDQFLSVVRVEPWEEQQGVQDNSEDNNDGFFLPGVPRRGDLTSVDVGRLVDTIKSDSPLFKRFIRRISTTLVIDTNVEEVKVEQIRELTRQMVGLNPTRGDTLDVQRASFSKSQIPIDNSTITKFQKGIQNYWLIISLALILFCVTIFFLFIFGPLRGFLNRFVQVLPTLKSQDYQRPGMGMEDIQSILPSLVAQHMGMLPGGGNPGNFSGSLQVENPNKVTTPFGFIREDHLSNLAILLSRETPDKAAVVLGYLPLEWISRVLTKIKPELQSEIARQLADTKQLLPEQVEDIEQDLRRRLDYLVGGPDRILAIYESLDEDSQRKMIENIREVRPELADEIRKHSILFEDLDQLDPASLKALLRDVDLQTMVVSLRGMPEEFVTKILEHVSKGKAEIVKEELELKVISPGKATKDAQRKIATIARRLEKEGQLQIPEIHTATPSRFSPSLRDAIKLPPGLKIDKSIVKNAELTKDNTVKSNIEDRIKKFMNRKKDQTERYPDDDQKQANG